MNQENTTLEEDTERPQLKPMTLTLKYTRTKFAKKIDAVLDNLEDPDLIGHLFMFVQTPEGFDFWNEQMINGLNEKGKAILMRQRGDERNEVVLDLSYPENGEHFATSQRHPTRQLGLDASKRALARHQFKFVDETIINAQEAMSPPVTDEEIEPSTEIPPLPATQKEPSKEEEE